MCIRDRGRARGRTRSAAAAAAADADAGDRGAGGTSAPAAARVGEPLLPPSVPWLRIPLFRVPSSATPPSPSRPAGASQAGSGRRPVAATPSAAARALPPRERVECTPPSGADPSRVWSRSPRGAAAGVDVLGDDVLPRGEARWRSRPPRCPRAAWTTRTGCSAAAARRAWGCLPVRRAASDSTSPLTSATLRG